MTSRAWALSLRGDPSLAAASRAVEDYISLHGTDAVRREFEADRSAICDRRFISQVCNGPERFGNEMGEFLNGFAFAVVANRTLAWIDTTEPCSQYLDFSGRILRQAELRSMLSEAGCALGHPAQTISSAGALKGVGFDQDMRRHISTRFWHREVAGKTIGNSGLRAESLLRGQSLFGASPLLGYHALFSAVWSFKESVRVPVDDMLKDQVGKFKVGLHLRHGVGCRDQRCSEADEEAVSCLKGVLSRSAPGFRGCLVLLATDRPESMEGVPKRLLLPGARTMELQVEQERMERLSRQIEVATGCNATSVLATKRQEHHFLAEHGPWVGETAMMDLYMLSRSDVLIGGSRRSSFSERAAEFFADSEAKVQEVHDWGSGC